MFYSFWSCPSFPRLCLKQKTPLTTLELPSLPCRRPPFETGQEFDYRPNVMGRVDSPGRRLHCWGTIFLFPKPKGCSSKGGARVFWWSTADQLPKGKVTASPNLQPLPPILGVIVDRFVRGSRLAHAALDVSASCCPLDLGAFLCGMGPRLRLPPPPFRERTPNENVPPKWVGSRGVGTFWRQRSCRGVPMGRPPPPKANGPGFFRGPLVLDTASGVWSTVCLHSQGPARALSREAAGCPWTPKHTGVLLLQTASFFGDNYLFPKPPPVGGPTPQPPPPKRARSPLHRFDPLSATAGWETAP